MFTEFRTDSLESEELIAADQPDSTMRATAPYVITRNARPSKTNSSTGIASDYALGTRSVYRHARALGLFERRAAHLRDALGYIIERVESASITADAVVRAVYAYSHLSPSGRWIEDAPLAASSPASSEANRHTCRVENDATC